MFLMFPEKESKVMVSVTVSGGRDFVTHRSVGCPALEASQLACNLRCLWQAACTPVGHAATQTTSRPQA
jgi:hypothetical protein